MQDLNLNQLDKFRDFIWAFYAQHGRSFAWRNVDDPYKVVVSEIMLQQTQTYRVAPKYEQFITTFPSFVALAQASLRDVLGVWQGLGYNRRGKALWEIACKVVGEYNGQLPDDPTKLIEFPGIGPGTAGSICAFAFNKPTIFIETNVRAVYIHSFFNDRRDVHDKEIMPLVQATVDQTNPREWYYALMDYGVHLKKQLPNPSRRSVHHNKQSKFEGSDRQIRGAIVRLLTEKRQMAKTDIVQELGKETGRVERILEQLCAEQMVKKSKRFYLIG